jgi:predicted Fe-Mo cluster-binding NifX family protein
MSFRVAVASIDSKHVNVGFSHAERFLVFGVSGRKFSYLGNRPNPGTGENRIEEVTKALADCQALFVSQIGPEEASLLGRSGIRTFMAAGTIATAIHELAASGKIR